MGGVESLEVICTLEYWDQIVITAVSRYSMLLRDTTVYILVRYCVTTRWRWGESKEHVFVTHRDTLNYVITR
jgi:hypothetical protein